MGSKPKSVSAPQANYQQDIGKFVTAYGKSLPRVIRFEKKFRPEFQALNLQDISGFLGGVGGQEGLFGLSRRASEEAQRQLTSSREAELGGMASQAPLTRGVMQGLSPEQAAAVSQAAQTAEQAQGLESDFMGRAGGMMGYYGSQVGEYDPTISGANADVSRATQMAEESFARRGTLSPEEQRMAQQQAREAGAASGRLGGNAAIAAEIQNREAAKAARRGEAAQFGQQAFGQQLGAAGQQLAAEQALFQQGIAGGSQRAQERQLGFSQLMDIEQRRAAAREEAAQAGARSYGLAQGFYTQPGLALLSQQPLSYQTGQSMLGLGMGGIKQGTPGLINPDVGLNLGAAERQNMLQASMANQQAAASRQAGMMSMLGSIGGAALAAPMTGGTSLAGMGFGALGFGK